jgi:hypothetical protein
VIEDKTRTTHQVPGTPVIDRAVVLKEMKKTSAPILIAARVERQGMTHMIEQEIRREKIGGGHNYVHIWQKAKIINNSMCHSNADKNSLEHFRAREAGRPGGQQFVNVDARSTQDTTELQSGCQPMLLD